MSWIDIITENENCIRENLEEAYKDALLGGYDTAVVINENGDIWYREHLGDIMTRAQYEGRETEIYIFRGREWGYDISSEEAEDMLDDLEICEYIEGIYSDIITEYAGRAQEDAEYMD